MVRGFVSFGVLCGSGFFEFWRVVWFGVLFWRVVWFGVL